MGFAKDEKYAAFPFCAGQVGGIERNGLHNGRPHRCWSLSRASPGWLLTYQIIVFTSRATAWPDLGDLWSLPFI
jgi:hypothetical protein